MPQSLLGYSGEESREISVERRESVLTERDDRSDVAVRTHGDDRSLGRVDTVLEVQRRVLALCGDLEVEAVVRVCDEADGSAARTATR